MPRPAQPADKARKAPARKRAPGLVAVRMLVGPQAGQVIAVSAQRARELCADAWTPQAELVARNVAADRETR